MRAIPQILLARFAPRAAPLIFYLRIIIKVVSVYKPTTAVAGGFQSSAAEAALESEPTMVVSVSKPTSVVSR